MSSELVDPDARLAICHDTRKKGGQGAMGRAMGRAVHAQKARNALRQLTQKRFHRKLRDDAMVPLFCPTGQTISLNP
ncbi:hypothetical protein AC630_19595 [Bradyrhizobium sp. AS23.2]|nr:hypothetical protein AC630_19595 [Bradyrhizobium sp. AS23.2]